MKVDQLNPFRVGSFVCWSCSGVVTALGRVSHSSLSSPAPTAASGRAGPALPCLTLPCPALRCPALRCPALRCPALPCADALTCPTSSQSVDKIIPIPGYEKGSVVEE